MQDKEFDDLFHSKLDNFEMEPSAQVWENIDAELKGRKKKALLPWLSIAASIIVLVIAGILFIPKKAKDDTTKPGKNNLAINHPASPVVKQHQDAPVKSGPEIKTIQPESTVPVNTIAAVRHTKKMIMPAKSTEQAAPVIKTEPVKVEEQQMIAAVTDPKTNEAVQHSVPGIETPLTIQQPPIDATPVTHDAPEVTTKPVLASAQLPAAKPNKVKKHGIRNFGDLVNLVVAKVDKRKDKVIQFTDTDDDGSTLTGVHVGAINIKKDNK